MTASASSFLSRARAHNNTTTLRWSREAAGLTWRSSLARRIRERDASRGARAAARSVGGRWIAARVGHTLGGARSHENGARAWVFRTRGGGRGGARAVGAGCVGRYRESVVRWGSLVICERVSRAAGRGGARSARERRRGAHSTRGRARMESGEFGCEAPRGSGAVSGAGAAEFILRGGAHVLSCGHTIETTPVPVKLPKLSSFWRS